MRTLLAILLLAALPFAGLTQSDSTKTPLKDKLRLSGYIKDLRSASFPRDINLLTTDNLYHNRLNFRAFVSKKITLGLEARNRIFYGETVRLTPGYADFIDADNGLVDLSWNWIDESTIVANSTLDRAWLQFANDKWDVRLGRQRINWGINTIWNPNDLFNTYNFIDFDYEERPGSDALRVQHFTGPMSSIELAIKPARNEDEWVGAMMYKFNKWNYDWQVLGGWYNQDYALGVGWAGNIKLAGFKGEATYFHPQNNLTDTSGVLSASMAVDYIFKSQLYLSGGFLYNSAGVINPNDPAAVGLFAAPISAKNLLPMRVSGLITAGYPISPLLNVNATVLFAPGVNVAFAMPSVTYSIAKNWDLSFFGQTLLANVGDGLGAQSTSVFVRLKWSF